MVLLVVVCVAAPQALAGGWEVIHREDGIEVSRKELPNRNLPIFRGETVVKANIYRVLAVLADFDRHKEWMHGCHSAKLLKEYDKWHRLSYNRADAPWPVSDRDVVLDSRVEVNEEEKSVLIHFRGVKSPLQPEVEDVVRMKRLKGYYKMTVISPEKTRVRYQVDADPGGSLPDWLASAASEDIPKNTLTNLRQRVREARLDEVYKAFLKAWDPDQSPGVPRLFEKKKEK